MKRRFKFKRGKDKLEFFADISENKGLEINAYWHKDYWALFSFNSNWTFKGDHPGFQFQFDILRFSFEFNLYDGRHWNWEADRFYLPGEEAAEREDL